jgi:hypothetical protein
MKTRMARGVFVTGMVIASFSSDAAEVNRTVVVPVGTTNRKIGYWGEVNPDCSSQGLPTVRITKSPTHGSLSERNGTDFPSFPSNNQRYRCNLRREPSVQLFYTPQPGFMGTDYVGVDVIHPDGRNDQWNFSITVK